MVWIIVLVICALFVALNGDSSGILAIAKIVGFGALLLGIMWLFVNCPWLILLFIIGFIIFIFASQSTKNTNNSTSTDNYEDISFQLNDDQIPLNPNLTGFKAELQKNTKTSNQVADEEWNQEKENIITIVENNYIYLKEELISKAKSAQYSINNGTRNITITMECSFLRSCIKRQYSSNPTGKQFTSRYRPNKKVTYTINNSKSYNFYLNELRKLALKDDIKINPVFSISEKYSNNDTYINLPYTDTQFLCEAYDIKVYLYCFIEY